MTGLKWELSMNRQRELKRRGIELLHERVKLLCDIYDDADFHAWCEANGMIDLDVLDAELADVACDFMTLKAVFVAHPNHEDWTGGDIRQMIAHAIEAMRPKRERSEVVSWKQRCLAAEKEIERLMMELGKRDTVIDELRSSLKIVASDGRVAA